MNKLAQSLMAKYGPKVKREGSRGGHVIGHEKDGDPIYASSKKAATPKPKAPPEAAPIPTSAKKDPNPISRSARMGGNKAAPDPQPHTTPAPGRTENMARARAEQKNRDFAAMAAEQFRQGAAEHAKMQEGHVIPHPKDGQWGYYPHHLHALWSAGKPIPGHDPLDSANKLTRITSGHYMGNPAYAKLHKELGAAVPSGQHKRAAEIHDAMARDLNTTHPAIGAIHNHLADIHREHAGEQRNTPHVEPISEPPPSRGRTKTKAGSDAGYDADAHARSVMHGNSISMDAVATKQRQFRSMTRAEHETHYAAHDKASTKGGPDAAAHTAMANLHQMLMVKKAPSRAERMSGPYTTHEDLERARTEMHKHPEFARFEKEKERATQALLQSKAYEDGGILGVARAGGTILANYNRTNANYIKAQNALAMKFARERG